MNEGLVTVSPFLASFTAVFEFAFPDGLSEEHGVCDVVQRDLNIELLDVLLTRKKCAELFQRITDKLKRLEGVPSVDPIDEERRNALAYATQAIPSIIDKIEYAKDTLWSKDFYDLAKYMEGVHVVNEYRGMVSTLYYPSVMTALHNDMRYSVYSSIDILRALDDEEGEYLPRPLQKPRPFLDSRLFSPVGGDFYYQYLTNHSGLDHCKADKGRKEGRPRCRRRECFYQTD